MERLRVLRLLASKNMHVFGCNNALRRFSFRNRRFVPSIANSQSVRTLSIHRALCLSSDQDFSKDPFVRDILKMVNEDFNASRKLEAEQEDTDENQSATLMTESAEDEYDDYIEDNEVYEELVEEVHPISLERGTTGVFDIEDLCQLLKAENAIDTCVIRIPEERNYVDYMVIVSGRSRRHILAMAEHIKKLFKLRRGRRDPASVDIEGRRDKDWLAMDLGNIAVHLFMPATRRVYDLETLWTVGEEFDDIVQDTDQADPYAFLFQNRTETETEGELNETETETEIAVEDDFETERRQDAIQSFASHSNEWHQSGS